MDGCNKMTCPDCGYMMCYLCRKPVKGYEHFVGQGGEPEPPHRVCPLWSNNDDLHKKEVAKVALEAKQTVTEENPNVKLKIDPTSGIQMPSTSRGITNNRAIFGEEFRAAYRRVFGRDPEDLGGLR